MRWIILFCLCFLIIYVNYEKILTFIKPKNILNYPNHIAFIMDGNGRWASKQNKDRSFGHLNGSNHLHEIIFNCFKNGSKYLTFYVFSEQNWKRPKCEIKNIFKIIQSNLNFFYFCKHNYRIIVQGRRDRIPKKLKKLIIKLEEETKENTNTIILCIDYSSRTEILNACKNLMERKLEPTLFNFTNSLYIQNIPDPDLIIRTSGEKRISDFLLWQASYAEFYFIDCYWPDFDLIQLEKAIINFNSRNRRFGNIK